MLCAETRAFGSDDLSEGGNEAFQDFGVLVVDVCIAIDAEVAVSFGLCGWGVVLLLWVHNILEWNVFELNFIIGRRGWLVGHSCCTDAEWNCV